MPRGVKQPRITAGPVVSAPAGRVQGVQRDGVEQFLGIPFAQAPIQTLRWAPPVPLRKWESTFQVMQMTDRALCLWAHILCPACL